MKRFLSVLLCVLMIALLTPSALAADYSGPYKDTLSNEIWTFSGSSNVGDYGKVGNVGSGSVTIDPTGGIDSSAALKMTRDSSSNIYLDLVDASSTGAGIQESAVEVKYSFKVSLTAMKAKTTFKYDNSDFIVLQFLNGNITFLNQVVGTYSANTWYDVEILIDMEQGYGRLKMKENGSSAGWNVYHVLSSKDGAMLKGKTYTKRISLGLETKEGDLYVDNYYQNRAVDVKPMVMDKETFTGLELSADRRLLGTWSTGNVHTNTFTNVGTEAIDGNDALKISASTDASQKTNASVYKNIATITTANAADDTDYSFKFKFGGNGEKSFVGASLGTYVSDTSKPELPIVRRDYTGTVYLLGSKVTDYTDAVAVEGFTMPEDVLYDAEAVYNPNDRTLKAVFTGDDGKQYSATTTLEGTPLKIALRNHIGYSDNAVGYFDDVEIGIIAPGGPVLDTAAVASGYEDAALLGETVEFTYDRTIDQSALSDVVVTLDGGEIEEKTLTSEEYKISSNGSKVMVTLLTALEKDTEYTVTITGVTDLAGGKTETADEYTYTTSATDIEVAEFEFDGDSLKAKVNSYYAQGKKVKLIAAVYNSTETQLKDVAVAEFNADSKAETDYVSIALSELTVVGGDKIKGFLWSDFTTMIPYIADIAK